MCLSMNTSSDMIEDNNAVFTPKIGVFPSVFATIIAICIVTLNSFSTASLLRLKIMRMQIKLPLLIVGISDLISGLSLLIMMVFIYSVEDFPKHHQRINEGIFFCLFFMYSSSFNAMTLLTIDRCLSLYVDIQYLRYMTTRVTILLYTSAFFVAFIETLTQVLLNDCQISESFYLRSKRNIVTACLGIIMRIVSIVAFIMTFSRLRGLTKLERTFGNKRYNAFHTGITVKCVFVTITFQVMYLPLFIFETIDLFCLECVHMSVVQISRFGIILNSIVNPFIYGLRFQECRQELKKMLCAWNKRVVENIRKEEKQKVAPFLKMTSVRTNEVNHNAPGFI